MIKKE